jgi:hypothetical protein
MVSFLGLLTICSPVLVSDLFEVLGQLFSLLRVGGEVKIIMAAIADPPKRPVIFVCSSACVVVSVYRFATLAHPVRSIKDKVLEQLQLYSGHFARVRCPVLFSLLGFCHDSSSISAFPVLSMWSSTFPTNAI